MCLKWIKCVGFICLGLGFFFYWTKPRNLNYDTEMPEALLLCHFVFSPWNNFDWVLIHPSVLYNQFFFMVSLHLLLFLLTQTISKLEFDFERKKLNKDDVRELIYREVTQKKEKILTVSYCSLVLFIDLTIAYLWKKNTRYWSIILRCWRNTSAVVISLASCTLG